MARPRLSEDEKRARRRQRLLIAKALSEGTSVEAAVAVTTLEMAPDPPKSRSDQVQDAVAYIKAAAGEMRRKGTTPRDIFEGNPEYFTGPAEILRVIRIQWMSDILWESRPVMMGYNWSMWKKLTGEMVERFQLEFNTKQRDPKDGTPRYGRDAFAVWCPEEVWQQQEATFRRNSMGAAYRTPELAKEQLNQMTDGMAIGTVSRRTTVTRAQSAEDMGTIDVPDDFDAEAQRQRKEVGVSLRAED